VGECSFWYRPTRVVPDQRPLNGRCCCCICKSAPGFRQITMPAPHHSVFYRLDAQPTAAIAINTTIHSEIRTRSSHTLYRSTSVSRRILLVQSFTACMRLLMATNASGLGRRRWSSPQQCYLHCLRTVKK